MTRLTLLALIPAACVGAGIGFLAGSGTTPPRMADKTTRRMLNLAPSAALPDPPRIAPPPASTAAAQTPRTFQNDAEAAATLRELCAAKDPRGQTRELHALCAAWMRPASWLCSPRCSRA